MAIIIGITGSIASGKTTLLGYLKEKGYKIFSSDDYVKKLYKRPEVIKELQEIFPDTDISDRKALAKIIYSNPNKKTQLEKLLHPKVRQGMKDFIQENESEDKIFLEVPLLFENGSDALCDITITLLCPKDVRLERAIGRGITPEIFNSIDKIQMPEELKKTRSDYSIDTSISWEHETKELERILEVIARSISAPWRSSK